MIHAAHLPQALNHIAHVFGFPPVEMIGYTSDDPHGGYHAAYDDGFPTGSLWRVEGQALYAIVRTLRPASILELGTWHGASATHLLQGLTDNTYGGLTCVDSREYGNIEIGGMIPDALRPRMTLEMEHIETFIPRAMKEGWRYDLIYEDAMHDAPQVEFIWKHADALLNPGGMIISHDAMHAVAGDAVREGIAKAGYETMNVLIAPADCGFALWRKWLT
jgi:predicted O-methyltransferase YrrM